MFHRIAHAAVAAVMACSLPLPAYAGSVIVNPTSVTITKAFAGSAVTLQNQGATEIRMEVSAKAWSQTSGEKMVTAPTQDLLVVPSLLQIAPGASRQIRIGMTKPAGATEQTYRLYLRELRNESVTAGTMGVSILTDIDIPVFVSNGTGAKEHLVLDGARGDLGRLYVSIKNEGMGHAKVRSIQMTAYDANKGVLDTQTLDGWYILPGANQDYMFRLAANACEKVTSVSVVETGSDGSSKTLSAPLGRACRTK